MGKPEKKERRKRIKDQNAKRAKPAKLPLSLEPRTREEFDRQVEGFAMMVAGFLRLAGVDLPELIEREQFPSELDVE